jgi:hypothetical protein
MNLGLVLLVSAALAGCSLPCGLGTKDDDEKSGPKGKTAVEIVEGGKDMPGNAVVTSDGKAVWPPSGPGCGRLVACCDAASKESSAVGLACQLSVGTRPLDCGKALESVQGIIAELGLKMPEACK